MDPPDVIRRKIKRAVTDSGTEVRGGPDKPALTNLLDIYSALTGEPVADIEARYEGKGYADFKADLGEVVVEALAPIQARIRELEADKSYTLEVLKTGAERAEAIAGAHARQGARARRAGAAAVGASGAGRTRRPEPPRPL